MIITIVGGYMNGYTYITRHNILANMHTANMSKLGINIALGQWQNALSFFIPIVACILGAAFSELVKALLIIHKFKGDWRKLALILEAISLFFIGLIPTSCPDIIVTNLVSFFMGYQLCLFRECLGIGFNTTICTGNIRNVGQLLYNALDEKSKDSIRKLIIFTCLTFSFALGAIPGTLISIAISTKAVWVCSFILLSQAVWINIYEHNVV
ncbi:YoaK family protein [Paraclostridium sordellii]|uniref:YoaK family protein n=1 Tax=Paraclostridium sordellii TaxID=1505 RepID=UPI0022E2F923|nr:YoaK family protein [Paeniclostridium sordellii]